MVSVCNDGLIQAKPDPYSLSTDELGLSSGNMTQSSKNENLSQIMCAREDNALGRMSSPACGFPINAHTGAGRISSPSASKTLVGGI